MRKRPDAETRTRYQMLLLSLQGQTSSQIAHIVLRSQDTVVRVLKRFLTGGLDAVPRRTAPGRERTVTAAWEAELLRVIELDPHEVGQDTANWTTESTRRVLRPADRHSGHGGDGARRTYMPMTTSASARPGRLAQSRRESRLRGKRLRVEVLLAGATAPEPLPVQ